MSDISEYRSKGNTPVIPATQETETGEFRASIVKKGPEFNLQYKMGKNIQEIFLANLLWWEESHHSVPVNITTAYGSGSSST